MSGCCGNDAKFDGVSDDYKRRLWIVIAINAAMFIIEMGAGRLAHSQALQADALDFLGDALTYGVSLAVIGASIRARTNAAIAKGLSLLLMGLWVFAATLYRIYNGDVPDAHVMGTIGALALVANLASVLILLRYKDGDANVRSVWLCSRNDAIGNIIVMIAALGVWGAASRWPDLIVATLMASLFVWSAFQIIQQARREQRDDSAHASMPTHQRL